MKPERMILKRCRTCSQGQTDSRFITHLGDCRKHDIESILVVPAESYERLKAAILKHKAAMENHYELMPGPDDLALYAALHPQEASQKGAE